MKFFNEHLLQNTEDVLKDINEILANRVTLYTQNAIDDDIFYKIKDFEFEYTALLYSLESERDSKLFLTLDAINGDLESYISNWEESDFLNLIEFKPFDFLSDVQNYYKNIKGV